MPRLRLHQTLHTGLCNMGFAVGCPAGVPLLVVTGQLRDGSRRPELRAYDAGGRLLWRDAFPEDTGPVAMGAEPHFLTLDGGRPVVAHTVAHRASGEDGLLRVLDVFTGDEVWRASTGSIYGGNRDIHCVDLDGDGRLEILAGYADRLTCYRAADGAAMWSRTDRIAVCWGRSAIVDIDADGLPEIVLGSEYANPDGTSGIFALRGDGSVMWEVDGIEGDCGSTPVHAVTLADGKPRLLKTEIDLEGRGPVHMARLWCLSAQGVKLWALDFGCGDIALADLDADGTPEAVGITSGRDGGDVPPAVRCANLTDGSLAWEIPLTRHWLTGWPATLSGQEAAYAVLPHGNPSGYGRRRGTSSWGELLLVGDGAVHQTIELPDWPVCAKAFDWTGDGEQAVMVSCGDGSVYVYVLDGE